MKQNEYKKGIYFKKTLLPLLIIPTSFNLLFYLQINEVKEVIQNRPNDEIQIVLSYYDLNVSKTINAFLNGIKYNLKMKFIKILKL